MRNRPRKVTPNPVKDWRSSLPLVGTQEWQNWLDSLATRLGRDLTREDEKYLIRHSNMVHDDKLRKGHMVQQRLYNRTLPPAAKRRK